MIDHEGKKTLACYSGGFNQRAKISCSSPILKKRRHPLAWHMYIVQAARSSYIRLYVRYLLFGRDGMWRIIRGRMINSLKKQDHEIFWSEVLHGTTLPGILNSNWRQSRPYWMFIEDIWICVWFSAVKFWARFTPCLHDSLEIHSVSWTIVQSKIFCAKSKDAF